MTRGERLALAAILTAYLVLLRALIHSLSATGP